MPHDPDDSTFTFSPKIPPSSGPGSGKRAWQDFAWEMYDANDALMAIIERQRGAIRDRDVEIILLKRQIAARKPKGARPPVPQEKVDRIEYEVAAGGSDRHIARMYDVSHVTVYRIRRRMAERERLAAGAG